MNLPNFSITCDYYFMNMWSIDETIHAYANFQIVMFFKLSNCCVFYMINFQSTCCYSYKNIWLN